MVDGVLTPENQNILDGTETKLKALFEEVKMPESHGLKHCRVVLGHMVSAIQASKIALTEDKKLMLCLAALLHEADDHKYFSTDSKNASSIMNQVLSENGISGSDQLISDVEESIALVSASVNGNSVPQKAVADPTILWPRFCDRLEAIGVIGAVRCLQYNEEAGDPFQTADTPRPTTEDQVWTHVTEERWNKYQNGGNSNSMMDHYYDKLLRVACPPPHLLRNSYLEAEMSKRAAPLVDVCLEYGKAGEVPLEKIRAMAARLAA